MQRPALLLLMLPLSMVVTWIIFLQNKKEKYTEPTETVVPEKAVKKIEYATVMAEKLAGYGMIYAPNVGFVSHRPHQYDEYIQFKERAAEDDLVRLTDNNNPVIKALAFNALLDRGSDKLLSVLERHLYDTSTFYLYGACLITPVNINIYFINKLENENNSHLLKKYRKIIAGQYVGKEYLL